MFKVKRLYPNAKVPMRQTTQAAGYDIHSVVEGSLKPGEKALVKTGIAIEIPDGYVGILKGRSSLEAKSVNLTGGVIDSDYRNEIKVILTNLGTDTFDIGDGERIAQMIIIKHETEPFVEVAELSKTSRTGGFGSTNLPKVPSRVLSSEPRDVIYIGDTIEDAVEVKEEEVKSEGTEVQEDIPLIESTTTI